MRVKKKLFLAVSNWHIKKKKEDKKRTQHIYIASLRYISFSDEKNNEIHKKNQYSHSQEDKAYYWNVELSLNKCHVGFE